MEEKKNWLKELNEIKLLELNINFIVRTFSNRIDKYFQIKNKEEIKGLIKDHLADIEENREIFASLEEMSNEKIFELYILLGINFLDFLKEDFRKNYL